MFKKSLERGHSRIALRGVKTMYTFLPKEEVKGGRKGRETLVRFGVLTATNSDTMLVNVLRRKMKTKREQHLHKYKNMLPNLKRNFP